MRPQNEVKIDAQTNYMETRRKDKQASEMEDDDEEQMDEERSRAETERVEVSNYSCHCHHLHHHDFWKKQRDTGRAVRMRTSVWIKCETKMNLSQKPQ